MKITSINPDLQAIIFAILFILAVIGSLVSYLITDNDLKNKERFQEIQENFEAEYKKIKSPDKTAINKFEDSSNNYISMYTRYRTELSQNEFENYFKQELKKQGWIYYGYEDRNDFIRRKSLVFCKGKFDAKLSIEPKSIWDDKADYYRLYFSFGQRELINSTEELPASCRY